MLKVKHNLHKLKSYTLIEMLVVLFIFSIISVISFINLNNFYISNKINKEIDNIGNNFNKYQSNSRKSNTDSDIKIADLTKFKFTTNFRSNIIHISRRGNIGQSGRIKVYYRNKNKTIIFSIGSGRYRIE